MTASNGLNVKISVTYLYAIVNYGYPPKPEDDVKALQEIRNLGFENLEMEGLGRTHGKILASNREAYKKALSDTGVHVHNFCIVDPDLVSPDKGKRQAAFDYFKEMADIACYLGAETLHLASYAPPVRYGGKAPYQLDGGAYEIYSGGAITIPEGFNWPRVWDNMVESVVFCAEEAAKRGKIILMEPRIGEIICSVDSMLRLLQDAGKDNLKANFDTGHISAQRENVSLALMKLEGKFANIHIADNDPVNGKHLPLGEGTIDWDEFFRILKRMNYQGYLGLDFSEKENLSENLIKSRDFVLAKLAKIR